MNDFRNRIGSDPSCGDKRYWEFQRQSGFRRYDFEAPSWLHLISPDAWVLMVTVLAAVAALVIAYLEGR